MRYSFILACLVVVGGLLTGCSGVREAVGLDRRSPDEFAVITRAPLAIPPENTPLLPPTPGAPRPQEQSASSLAKSALLGVETGGEATTPSAAETLILDKADASNSDPSIRDQVAQERNVAQEQPVFDRLLGRITQEDEAPAKTLDPMKEQERLRQTHPNVTVPTKPSLPDGGTPSPLPNAPINKAPPASP